MEIILRHWCKEDLDNVLLYANNSHIAGNLRDTFPFPYTREDAQWFVDYALKNESERELLYAIDLDGQAVGSISATFHHDIRPISAEIGYWLGEPFWNRGIITQAVGMICRQIFSTTDTQRIFAEVFVENAASRRVLEKCGFTLERVMERSVYKNGLYLDSCTYQIYKQDFLL